MGRRTRKIVFFCSGCCWGLTDQQDLDHARNYWKVLKHRLKKEGLEPVTICNQLKLVADDGKMRLTDVADIEQIFRIIQSIPSPKALALRLNKKVSTPDVVFTPGISADACGISEYEALKFIDDANLIYKLHLNFTSEFYHRQVSLLSLERCEELFNEIDEINL